MSPEAPHVVEWLDGPGGHRFHTHTFSATQPKAVVIFVHGFADHIGRYTDFLSKFPPSGITVFAYDLRGFGLTALDEDNRSPEAAFGKTSTLQEQEDMEWWLKHVALKYPLIPVFLMGHSMGGASVCALVTRTEPPPSPETVDMVSGVITNAPLFELTEPIPVWLKVIATAIAALFPNLPFPARMVEDRFSRDPAVVQALLADPLRKHYGRSRGLVDMMDQPHGVLQTECAILPLCSSHSLIGTTSQANSIASGLAFYEQLPVDDKKLFTYEGARHDLFHEIEGIPDALAHEYIAWIEAHINQPLGRSEGSKV
ncbi:lysophospholipase [Lentinus brumalis]|uniref:Lysophospholipase n=1 Tax=Lentinus brumalis TaxID=2498619 RepID=A0A371CQ17_9APHY|nr:lysophospholipase [Polyporus brumalis]